MNIKKHIDKSKISKNKDSRNGVHKSSSSSSINKGNSHKKSINKSSPNKSTDSNNHHSSEKIVKNGELYSKKLSTKKNKTKICKEVSNYLKNNNHNSSSQNHSSVKSSSSISKSSKKDNEKKDKSKNNKNHKDKSRKSSSTQSVNCSQGKNNDVSKSSSNAPEIRKCASKGPKPILFCSLDTDGDKEIESALSRAKKYLDNNPLSKSKHKHASKCSQTCTVFHEDFDVMQLKLESMLVSFESQKYKLRSEMKAYFSFIKKRNNSIKNRDKKDSIAYFLTNYNKKFLEKYGANGDYSSRSKLNILQSTSSISSKVAKYHKNKLNVCNDLFFSSASSSTSYPNKYSPSYSPWPQSPSRTEFEINAVENAFNAFSSSFVPKFPLSTSSKSSVQLPSSNPVATTTSQCESTKLSKRNKGYRKKKNVAKQQPSATGQSELESYLAYANERYEKMLRFINRSAFNLDKRHFDLFQNYLKQSFDSEFVLSKLQKETDNSDKELKNNKDCKQTKLNGELKATKRPRRNSSKLSMDYEDLLSPKEQSSKKKKLINGYHSKSNDSNSSEFKQPSPPPPSPPIFALASNTSSQSSSTTNNLNKSPPSPTSSLFHELFASSAPLTRRQIKNLYATTRAVSKDTEVIYNSSSENERSADRSNDVYDQSIVSRSTSPSILTPEEDELIENLDQIPLLKEVDKDIKARRDILMVLNEYKEFYGDDLLSTRHSSTRLPFSPSSSAHYKNRRGKKSGKKGRKRSTSEPSTLSAPSESLINNANNFIQQQPSTSTARNFCLSNYEEIDGSDSERSMQSILNDLYESLGYRPNENSSDKVSSATKSKEIRSPSKCEMRLRSSSCNSSPSRNEDCRKEPSTPCSTVSLKETMPSMPPYLPSFSIFNDESDQPDEEQISSKKLLEEFQKSSEFFKLFSPSSDEEDGKNDDKEDHNYFEKITFDEDNKLFEEFSQSLKEEEEKKADTSKSGKDKRLRLKRTTSNSEQVQSKSSMENQSPSVISEDNADASVVSNPADESSTSQINQMIMLLLKQIKPIEEKNQAKIKLLSDLSKKDLKLQELENRIQTMDFEVVDLYHQYLHRNRLITKKETKHFQRKIEERQKISERIKKLLYQLTSNSDVTSNISQNFFANSRKTTTLKELLQKSLNSCSVENCSCRILKNCCETLEFDLNTIKI